MKIITLIIAFLWSMSVWADLQWMEYNPKGDYGDRFPVIGSYFVNEGEFFQEGICLTRDKDEEGVWRIGKVTGNHHCHYVTDQVDEEETQNSSSWFRKRYVWEGTSTFLVLTAQNNSEFQWINQINLQHFEGFMSPVNGADGVDDEGELGPLYICRGLHRTKGTEDRGFHSGQLYLDGGTLQDGHCYFEFGWKGRRVPDVYTSNYSILMQPSSTSADTE